MLAKFAAIVLRKDILGTIVPMTMIALGTYNTPKIVMIMSNSTTKKTGATMLKNLIRMNLLNATNVVMMHSGEEVIMNVNNADGVDYLMTIDTHCNSGEDFPRLFSYFNRYFNQGRRDLRHPIYFISLLNYYCPLYQNSPIATP